MRKDEIVNELARTLLDKKQAADAVESLIAIIKRGLERDGKVVIANFGSFNVVRQRPVTRHNPKTLEKVQVPEKQKVRFKPSENILN